MVTMSGTPYAVSARGYFPEWSPIPLPVKEKWPPPDGFTGAGGAYVDGTQLDKWLGPRGRFQSGSVSSAPGNIGIRLPKNVLGIDVDAYGDKAGEQTLSEAELEWGELPLTYVSSSRSDGVSGIRLYIIPEGLTWPGQLPQGGGVELIRWDHRYLVAPPSVHPNGAVYAWYQEVENPGDLIVWDPLEGGSIPVPEDLPELPVAWVDGLTQGRAWKDRAIDGEMDSEAATLWLKERPAPGDMCSGMRRTVTEYQRQVRAAGDDGGAHDKARDGAWALIGDAAQGHSGINKALGALRGAFIEAVEKRRGKGADGLRLAKAEWSRIVLRGVAKVSAEGEPEEQDPCTSLSGKRGSKERIAPDASFDLNEKGNADRLLFTLNNRARYSEAMGGWMIWSEQDGHWSADPDGQMERWGVKSVDLVLAELSQLEGEGANAETIKAYKAHHKSSLRLTAVQTSIKYVRGRKGMTVPAERFDGDPSLLNCSNGTVVLGEDGVTFRRGHLPDDYLTRSTGVEYVEGARSETWDGYLDLFFPDPEIREWLQRLVGYSLFGENPEQLIIVGKGGTSMGKSTLIQALFGALGRYAGPANPSLLRGGSEDRPRPDILKALPQRLVIADELSEYQNLHADQIKRITGAGTLSARGMNSNAFVERVPAFTPWIFTNETPNIDGADEAMKNRLLVVPFTVQQTRNRSSAAKRSALLRSREGLQSVLAWAVEGWDRYATEGGDLRAAPAGALAAGLEFSEEMSEFAAFLSDCCDMGDDFREAPIDLFESYQNWCEVTDVAKRDRRSMTQFGKDLKRRGFRRQRLGPRGEQMWYSIGIRLTDSARRTE